MKYRIEEGKHCLFVKDTDDRIVGDFGFDERERAEDMLEKIKDGLILSEIEVGMKVKFNCAGGLEHGVVTGKDHSHAFVKLDWVSVPIIIKAGYLRKDDKQ